MVDLQAIWNGIQPAVVVGFMFGIGFFLLCFKGKDKINYE
jgi:hypothetical protein